MVLIVELLASLLVALCAPAWLLARALDGMSTRQRHALARVLTRYKARGRFLLYAGENDTAALRRLDRAKWIARDPIAALKHMVRQTRCPLARARFAMVAPVRFAPAAGARAPDITDDGADPFLDDSS